MDYKTFEAEYRRLLEMARSMDAEGFAAEVERLRVAAADVQPDSDQERTVSLVKSLDRAIAAERSGTHVRPQRR